MKQEKSKDEKSTNKNSKEENQDTLKDGEKASQKEEKIVILMKKGDYSVHVS